MRSKFCFLRVDIYYDEVYIFLKNQKFKMMVTFLPTKALINQIRQSSVLIT